MVVNGGGRVTPVVLAVGVGTSSTQACVVDMAGRVVRHANRSHSPVSPGPGQFEMDAAVWWLEFASLSRELLGPGDVEVQAVGVSGMGPCVLIADESDKPLRPAILYGVDTRATEQIRRLESQLGADEILHRCGSGLSSQAVG